MCIRDRDYLDALFKELDFVKRAYAYKELQTMYIGGGTPTSLNEQDLEYLLCEINKRFPLSKIKEITVEAGRPDSLNLEKLKILKKYGVTRISINPQSMNDKDVYKRQLQKKSQDPKTYQEAMGEYLKRLGAYAKVSVVYKKNVKQVEKILKEAGEHYHIIPGKDSMTSPEPVSYTHLDVYKRQE